MIIKHEQMDQSDQYLPRNGLRDKCHRAESDMIMILIQAQSIFGADI